MFAENSKKIITLVGGSGFIGRHMVRALAKRGYRVRVACRRPDLAGHVQPLGVPGQIVPVQANVRYPESLTAACSDAYAVINLTGILAESHKQRFQDVHVTGAEAVAKAARAAGAQNFIHLSALGADLESESEYLESKAEGEKRVKAAFPGAMILRPSLVFGPEDNFFNQFARMSRFSWVLPLIGGGETKFAPVFVGDVAETAARLIDAGVPTGKIYELGGPEVFTFRQLLIFILATVDRSRLLVPVPWILSEMTGSLLSLLPGKLLTYDQVIMLKQDNLVRPEAVAEGRDLAGLGILPRSIQAIVPSYLYRYRKAGQFTVPSDLTK